jgi:polyhydroxyalkanoate synthase
VAGGAGQTEVMVMESGHVRSVYKLQLVVDVQLTFLPTSGGHNAGIVSEPGHRRRSFQCATRPADAPYLEPDRWLPETPTHDGSWWPAWAAWQAERSGAQEPPSHMGAPARGYPPIVDAPGTYVLQR